MYGISIPYDFEITLSRFLLLVFGVFPHAKVPYILQIMCNFSYKTAIISISFCQSTSLKFQWLYTATTVPFYVSMAQLQSIEFSWPKRKFDVCPQGGTRAVLLECIHPFDQHLLSTAPLWWPSELGQSRQVCNKLKVSLLMSHSLIFQRTSYSQ